MPKKTGCKAIPLFPIELWNCYQRVLNDEDRVNNSIESWHKQFESDAGKHPTVNKALEQFRIEQKHTEILLQQIGSGDFYERRTKGQKRDENIKKVVLSFHSLTIEEYFESICLAIELI